MTKKDAPVAEDPSDGPRPNPDQATLMLDEDGPTGGADFE